MQEVNQYIKTELAGLYPETELKMFGRLIIEKVSGLDFSAQQISKNLKITTVQREKIEGMVLRLKKFEPIQYVLGEVEFYNVKLNVNPAVLIPRPETEELVHWIIKTNTLDAPKILDIGTGSACIALALKKSIQNAHVSAVDISQSAVETARENALKNAIDIKLFQADILLWEKFKWERYDVIVSNPPYVRESEKVNILSNVLLHEPANALFVPNDDPFLFYRRIAAFANVYLKENGKLFFEINEALGAEMHRMLSDSGFSFVQIKKDLNGKNRMIRCLKQSKYVR